MAAVYEGYFAAFKSVDKSEGAILLGADCIVGDRCTVQLVTEDGKTTAWVFNKFEGRMGYLDEIATRRQQLAEARGLETVVYLSSVFYADQPEPGYYGGEIAVIHIAPDKRAAFDAFCSYVGEKLADGMKPAIELSDPEVNAVLADPQWHPAVTPATGTPVEGGIALKSRQTLSEKIVEQGRKKNPGCYIISIAFLAAIAVGVIFLVMQLVG